MNEILNNTPNSRIYEVCYTDNFTSVNVGKYEILKYNIITDNLNIKNDMYPSIINIFKSLLNKCYIL